LIICKNKVHFLKRGSSPMVRALRGQFTANKGRDISAKRKVRRGQATLFGTAQCEGRDDCTILIVEAQEWMGPLCTILSPHQISQKKNKTKKKKKKKKKKK
jgi:hypothetical protein